MGSAAENPDFLKVWSAGSTAKRKGAESPEKSDSRPGKSETVSPDASLRVAIKGGLDPNDLLSPGGGNFCV